jgi:hypothetical protein
MLWINENLNRWSYIYSLIYTSTLKPLRRAPTPTLKSTPSLSTEIEHILPQSLGALGVSASQMAGISDNKWENFVGNFTWVSAGVSVRADGTEKSSNVRTLFPIYATEYKLIYHREIRTWDSNESQGHTNTRTAETHKFINPKYYGCKACWNIEYPSTYDLA